MARRTRTFVRPAPRSNVWLGIDLSGQTVAANSQVLLGSLNAGALLLRPFTIVRTRLRILIQSDQEAVSEEVRVFFGGMVVTEQAVAIGVTAVPGPDAESDGDWYVYDASAHKMTVLSAVGQQTPVGTQLAVDSKAMRKVANNRDSIFVAENTAGVGARITVCGRQLIKLH